MPGLSFEDRVASVDPRTAAMARAAGYEPAQMGGHGTLGWCKRTSGGDMLWIDNEFSIDGDPDARVWRVGRWHGEASLCVGQDMTLAKAIEAGPLLPAPFRADGAPMCDAFDTLAEALAATG